MKKFFQKLLTKFKNIYFLFLLFFFVSSIFFYTVLLKINILGIPYMVLIAVLLFLLFIFNYIVLLSKKLKKKIKVVFSIFSILFSILFVILGIVFLNIYSSVQSMFSNHSMIHYSVYVEKKSSYQKIGDIKDKIMGYYTEDKYSEMAEENLEKEVEAEFVGYSTLEDLTDALENGEIDAILLMDSYLDVLQKPSEEEDTNMEKDYFTSETRIIYTFEIAIDQSDSIKKIDLEKGTFVVYVSGQDSYADHVSDTSRSDVNMLMVVNLKSKQILLLSIPRDYYISIHGKGVYDKLTHISLYGSEVAAQSIGDLLNVDVDYFVKFNFTTFMKAIEYFLPLDVYSDYDFTTSVYDQTIGNLYTFKKGYNHITSGEMALQFVRARKNFSEGDRQRGINQTRMLRAVIKKAATPSVLLKYNDILKSLDGTFLTNISDESILEIIKYLINHNGKFEISGYSLDGYDGTRACYSSGSQALYVMLPNQDTVLEASQYIQNIMNGEKPDIEVDASELADIGKTQEVTKSIYKENYSSVKNTVPSSKDDESLKDEPEEVEEETEDDTLLEEGKKEDLQEEEEGISGEEDDEFLEVDDDTLIDQNITE